MISNNITKNAYIIQNSNSSLELPAEEEPDEPLYPDEYEESELKKIIDKKMRIYLSKTSSQGRSGGVGAACNYVSEILI